MEGWGRGEGPKGRGSTRPAGSVDERGWKGLLISSLRVTT